MIIPVLNCLFSSCNHSILLTVMIASIFPFWFNIIRVSTLIGKSRAYQHVTALYALAIGRPCARNPSAMIFLHQ